MTVHSQTLRTEDIRDMGQDNCTIRNVAGPERLHWWQDLVRSLCLIDVIPIANQYMVNVDHVVTDSTMLSLQFDKSKKKENKRFPKSWKDHLVWLTKKNLSRLTHLTTTRRSSQESELLIYCNKLIPDIDESPFNVNSEELKIFSGTHTTQISIYPASVSILSEQLFSSAGLIIYNRLRNSMHGRWKYYFLSNIGHRFLNLKLLKIISF